MKRCTSLILVGLWVTNAAPLMSADVQSVEALLKKEVVGSVLPLAEVQKFCETRVPILPQPDSADQWNQEAARLRTAILEKIVYRGEAAQQWRDAETRVEWLDTIEGGPGYQIQKLRFEALPGLWVPALLYKPNSLSQDSQPGRRVPAILNVNGHSAQGTQYPPKQIRCINQAKRGMLALNVEWIGMGQLRGPGYTHYRMNQLDLCGASGLAPFYLSMKRSLDLLLSLEHTDPERVAVTGLSGGGWQTIVISALDTRVKLANPVAGYSSFRTRAYHFKDLGDSEQTPNDLATLADYTHLTAMLAPRPALLTYNSKDNCCFESGYALQPLLDAATPMYRLLDRAGAIRSHVNDDPGTHNYERENREAFYRMLGDFFFVGDETFDPTEIPSEKEVKAGEDLSVELPEGNQDFNTLAMTLGKALPREPDLPHEEDAAIRWQQAGRERLRELVRAEDYRVQAIEFEHDEQSGTKATYWKLKMNGQWTVPVVELTMGEPQQTTVLVAEGGRTSAAEIAGRLLSSGHRVLAVDPFYFGENKITQRPQLFALLVSAVGSRPLGIQASELAATSRWSIQQHGQPVSLVAIGPRASLFALVAAGLDQGAIRRVEMHNSLGSLKEVIEQNWSVSDKPELFCFGLLEAFDIKQLAALVAPRSVEFRGASDRLKTEVTGLTEWYQVLGGQFQPGW